MNPTTTARGLAATAAAESREILRLLDHAQDYLITSMAEEAKNEISTSPFLILKYFPLPNPEKPLAKRLDIYTVMAHHPHIKRMEVMMKTKRYYIVQVVHGCFGAPATIKRLDGVCSNKRLIQGRLNKLVQSAKKGTVYWIDFDFV